jgi:2-keto-3-deoxy-L-rhamnonate aldolase RhmA
MLLNPDLFSRLEEKPTLFGCAIDSASPAVAELAGLIGFDVVWADMEHRWINFERIEEFCRGARSGGAIPMIRIPNTSRDYVLHALDAGASIVVAPMVETAETSREMVRHGKFLPSGNRGYNGATPGMGYALGSREQNMRDANERLALLVQIESGEAAENCNEIVSVDGIAGSMVGPADLSIALGKPMQFDDADFQSILRKILRTIRGAGKLAAIAGGHPALVRVALEESAQLVICASEANGLRGYLQKTLADVQEVSESIQKDAASDSVLADDVLTGSR